MSSPHPAQKQEPCKRCKENLHHIQDCWQARAVLNIVATAIISYDMSETIGFLMGDSARLFRRAFNARTRDSGITALQWRLITYLKPPEGIRTDPLADLIKDHPITHSRGADPRGEAGGGPGPR